MAERWCSTSTRTPEMSRGPGTDVRDHGLRRVIETGTGVSTKLYSVLGVVREEGGRRGRACLDDSQEQWRARADLHAEGRPSH